MLRLRKKIGIVVLAVVGFGCIAAADASAEQRAYVCTEAAATKEFSDSDCSFKGEKNFGHLLIAPGSATSITSSNTVFSWKLTGSLSGISTEIQCSFFSGSGELTNAASSVSGRLSPNLTGCSVAKPLGKGCLVRFGSIELGTTKFTTVGQFANRIKFTPSEGEFGTVPIENCSVKALNHEFPLTGSFVATTSGANLTTTEFEVTAQGTFEFGGVEAGLESRQTMKALSSGDAIALT